MLRLTDPRRFGAVVWGEAMDAGMPGKLLAGLGREPFDEALTAEVFHAGLRGRQVALKQALLAGDIVVGATQGASCFGAAYEFLFNTSYQLRKAGLHKKVKLTYLTAEPFLGHFGIGGLPHGDTLLGMFLKKEGIAHHLNKSIAVIEDGAIITTDGDKLKNTFNMIVPPFSGQDFLKAVPGLADAGQRVAHLRIAPPGCRLPSALRHAAPHTWLDSGSRRPKIVPAAQIPRRSAPGSAVGEESSGSNPRFIGRLRAETL